MKHKKDSLSYLKKLLDQEFSLLVRAKGACEKCGKATSLQCAHVIPKSTSTLLRWDIFNALCLCLKCHLYWAHKSPLEFTEWFKVTFPERHGYLMEHAHEIVKFAKEDLEDKLWLIRMRKLDKLVIYS